MLTLVEEVTERVENIKVGGGCCASLLFINLLIDVLRMIPRFQCARVRKLERRVRRKSENRYLSCCVLPISPHETIYF